MARDLETLTDAALVLRVQASGDRQAYGVLVGRHQAGLRAFLWRLAGSASEADDVAQETLIRAFDGIRGFASRAAFRSWLFAIGYREFLRGRRKARTYVRVLSEMEAPDAVAAGTDPAMALDLQRALSTLSLEERAALLLCDASGMSHGEAAETLGLPLGSVKTYLQRGRARMRGALGLPDEIEEASQCRIAR